MEIDVLLADRNGGTSDLSNAWPDGERGVRVLHWYQYEYNLSYEGLLVLVGWGLIGFVEVEAQLHECRVAIRVVAIAVRVFVLFDPVVIHCCSRGIGGGSSGGGTGCVIPAPFTYENG